jgi:hypothetical protein
VTDTARVLLTAGVLSATAASMFAWRVGRIDAERPERLIGELRLAQWAALVLAAVSAMSIGLAVAAPPTPTAQLDAALGIAFLVLAGLVLLRDPREALLLVSLGFVLHALVDIGHRPGLLSPDLAPRWFTIGGATYDLYLAALCYWLRRR